jgi:ech hydrogenase subunit F
MFKMLKQGILKKGIVTKNYPAEHFEPAEGYMGMPSVDPGRCDLCGECAKACPSGAVRVSDKVEISPCRCVFCAACRDVCPKKAIAMTDEYELAFRPEAGMKVKS